MSDLQVLNYGTKQVRTVQMEDGLWWVLKDVCYVLDIHNHKMTAQRLDEDEVSQTDLIDKLGRKQKTTIVNQSGLYSVILHSDKPEAKPFKRWVTYEVLPSIFKTGKYEMPKAETKPYEYFNKTYNGVPVLTVKDVEYITKIKVSTINWFLRTHAILGKDYYILENDKLKNYKRDNPKTAKTTGVLNVVTRNGFVKICKAYGIQVEEPKCFEDKAEQLMIDLGDKSPKSEDEKILENIEKARNKTITVNVLLDAVDRLLELKKDSEYANTGKMIC